ncbi:SDR family NAD(P)-dependent oxidoreductase [Agrobacterium tumefaciens]|jgi:NAD(P)-dependent dehydrogenase (short-subunit alcohol dehydrogenase family)|uniref:SDR family NAD(P)-dependent oxidoreductase n=2 Tax=Rhizobium/Agrobacterium group TaxID=227290 RepID=UPI001B8A54C3
MEDYMLMRDKVCAITGAASPHGIGRATAQLVAQNGGKLVILDVSDSIHKACADLQKEFPNSEIVAVQTDISSRSDCKLAIEVVLERFGRVDALIHCAGVMRAAKFEEISEQDLTDVLSVNLAGTFNIVGAFSPSMIAQGSGSIVNVSSVAAQRGGGLFGGSHYAASKGGVLSFTRTLAREFGASGVRVNAVCPSLIETDFVASAITPERLRELSTAIPLGRPGRPSEVAGACMFLASDLSTYITGATIDVNGGIHIH